MKINLFSKKKDDQSNGELHKRKGIKDVFFTSDDEESFVFESNQNKKIEEKEKQRIEEEIKDFINEHEHSSEETRRRKEEAEKKEKERSRRKKIIYLGYKGKELTEIKQGGKERAKEKDHTEGQDKEQDEKYEQDEYSSRSSSFSRRKEKQRKKIQKQRESHQNEKKRESRYKNISRSYNREKEKERVKHSYDGLPSEQFVDPRRKEVNVDEIFGKKEVMKDNEKNSKTEKPKPQYMDALINSAKRRKLEKEILIQKKLKVDTEKEEKVFITSAYRKIMMDRELIKQEILREEEEKERERKGAQRNLNLSTFYRNINAPSNYDRLNRRPYSSDRSSDNDY